LGNSPLSPRICEHRAENRVKVLFKIP